MRLPTAKTKWHSVTFCGGPWSSKKAFVPQPGIGMDDPWSLPIRVGEHVGRYNLSSGEWQELNPE